ncbi:hypothetical protein ESA_03987 [Cronobacter sakazakii ATCC BAA-894]|uniref:Uncharacterized protein n=1 Tax=Cronobacter sakazakii (strain ATCC BAA-894) TaxID=290339 RepID=A7MMZ5_CROS8|nr:hypothetical protein ESA_03987 [Cronobacter sakazakii ATCC BAA-894]
MRKLRHAQFAGAWQQLEMLTVIILLACQLQQAAAQRHQLSTRFQRVILIIHPDGFIFAKRMAGLRCERVRKRASGGLKFHIQPTTAFGGNRHTQHIAGMGERKIRKAWVSKARTALLIHHDFRQHRNAIEHKYQLGQQRARRQKTAAAVLRQVLRGFQRVG